MRSAGARAAGSATNKAEVLAPTRESVHRYSKPRQNPFCLTLHKSGARAGSLTQTSAFEAQRDVRFTTQAKLAHDPPLRIARRLFRVRTAVDFLIAELSEWRLEPDSHRHYVPLEAGLTMMLPIEA